MIHCYDHLGTLFDRLETVEVESISPETATDICPELPSLACDLSTMGA